MAITYWLRVCGNNQQHSPKFHLIGVFGSCDPGQTPAALLHAVPRSGRPGELPHPRAGREGSGGQAGARAEAEHHLAVVLVPGAAGALPAPGPGQALQTHPAAHGHRRADR